MAERIERTVGEYVPDSAKERWDKRRALLEELRKPVTAGQRLLLSKVFPRPDYAAWIKEGLTNIEDAAAIEALRNDLKAAFTSSAIRDSKKIEVANDIRSLAARLLDGFSITDAMAAKAGEDEPSDKMRRAAQHYQEKTAILLAKGFPDIPKGADKLTIQKLGSGWRVTGTPTLQESWEKALDVLCDEVASIRKGAELRAGEAKGPKFEVYRYRGQRHDEGWIIGVKKKGAGTGYLDLESGFATTKAADAFLESPENRQALVEKVQKAFTIYPMRRADNEARQGMQWRAGERNISPEEYTGHFGFRALQFGTTTSQVKRQADLNDTYDAYHDLALALGVSPASLSLNGDLAMAFGARGRGGRHAATYSPNHRIINLTAKRGPGTLAHEWGHAADHAVARAMGYSDYHASEMKDAVLRSHSSAMADAYRDFREAISATAMGPRAAELDSRRKKYHSEPSEIFARVFEQCIQERLAEHGIANDYLVNFVPEEEYQEFEVYPYLTAEEVPIVMPVIDRWIEAVADFLPGVERELVRQTGLSAMAAEEPRESPDQQRGSGFQPSLF